MRLPINPWGGGMCASYTNHISPQLPSISLCPVSGGAVCLAGAGRRETVGTRIGLLLLLRFCSHFWQHCIHEE
ncbi:hypothetical protein XELAEV_18030324mg [Xenopus laevis]|uniref:Uncharacterized protein n=1 Tax=Xenopus laevis TaxID=8355 RepID=A0A974CUX5_XENLA|nr:hypothetical protein XELAEV_18030324mg [Xenopus laevis]